MKIYLLDTNPIIIDAWSQYFGSEKNITIVKEEFKSFMVKNKVDCVVSPANSYGIMNGGYDLAISEFFGWDLTKNVQKYIQKKYKGLQPVGTAFIIDIPKSKCKLIHCPTMIEPSVIEDERVVFNCMYATLRVAIDNDIKSIVIPAFGGSTGKVEPYTIAKLMFEAYKNIKN